MSDRKFFVRGVVSVLAAPILAAIAVLAWTSAGAAQGRGPGEGRGLGPFGEGQGQAHAVFRERCQACHSHLGEIAYDTLVLKDGRLVSRKTGADAAEFLRRHERGLGAADTGRIVEAMRRQMDSAHRFRERCAICHVRIRDVAMDLAVTADERLAGIYSGRDMAEFLPGHGRLDAVEADRFARILKRTVEGRD